MTTYVLFLLLSIQVATFLAKRAPVSVIAGLWFAMMAWEAYDMHPDHALYYSALFGWATYKAVHRNTAATKPLRDRIRNARPNR